MHRQHSLSNAQQRVHTFTGGKSPLHYELVQKLEEPSFPQAFEEVNLDENFSAPPYQRVCPSRNYHGKQLRNTNYGSGKQVRTTNRSSGKQARTTSRGKVLAEREKKPRDKEDKAQHLPTLEEVRAEEGQNLVTSKLPFLWKLHIMLDEVEKSGDQHIVSWFEHGRSFRVHKPKAFVKKIIPLYFRQTHYKSFQRQLHLYEFTRTKRGPEAGAYSHSLFIRGSMSLCLPLSPKKIKGKYTMKQNKQKKTTNSTLGLTTAQLASDPKEVIPAPASSTMLPIRMLSSFAEPASFKVDKAEGERSETYFEREENDGNGPNASFASTKEDCTFYSNKQWAKKLSEMLVTGASLAAQLEEKKPVPHQGDMAYVFGGMPFRYIEHVNKATEDIDIMATEEANDPDYDALSDCCVDENSELVAV